ncbi:MAG: hypothetical protein QGH33_15980, partial [Pirellulaceae bacterium]|nr:hypothetical protein [Pirellulaceae bacterium]
MTHWFNVGGPLSTMMDWLLGLSRVSWSDPRSVVSSRFPLETWAWAIVVLAALAVGFWSYHRLLVPHWIRIILVLLRAAVFVFLVGLLTGPLLVVEQVKEEIGWVILLVDRSASMNIQDAIGSDPIAPDTKAAEFDSGITSGNIPGLIPVSRDTALRHAFARHAGAFASDRLGPGRQLLWLGFDEGVFSI